MLNLALLLCATAAVVALLYCVRRLSNVQRELATTVSALEGERRERDEDRAQSEERIRRLDMQLAKLAKWQSVVDAEAKAAELLESAQTTFDRATAEAETIRSTAQNTAASLLAEARTEANSTIAQAREMIATANQEAQEMRVGSEEEARAVLEAARMQAAKESAGAREAAKNLRNDAHRVLESASVQAKEIVDAANKRGEEIAGAAFQAMNNAVLYEQTVKAMKNLIHGYGDEYLVPERSLVDDLAEDFGHTDAGAELKKARERSKAMVRSGTAATCEYVEITRRTTAMNFVTDAFNGKVDSILSRVRSDNAGTLRQEIRDAFTLVNYNGKAFRDARITEEYLDARLAELKWSAIAQQLKLDEREEQRRIKEQMREEEKARREYERAMREAARDEDMLRKAMEKALQRVHQATEAQKAQYEQQLADLAEKLRVAEERSQRALSMAQQTRRGHVYIISNVGSFGNDIYKIGLTRRLEPLDRIRELGDSSVPFEFDVHALIFAEDAPALETRLHQHFLFMQMNKVNHRKEFFKVDLEHIRDEVEKLGLSAKWTMTAEARQFRETLAIEKAMTNNPALRDAWMKRQLELEPVSEDEEDAVESAAAG